MELKITCWISKNYRYIDAYDNINRKKLGSLIIELDCDEYPRYKNLCNGTKFAKIIRVETNVNYVGQGIASTLLYDTIERFKEYNFVLLCKPQNREGIDTLKTPSDLKIFYSKFGFSYTGELIPTMIRKASSLV